jgi:hypothetical protein
VPLQSRPPLRVAALVSGVRAGIRWTAFWIAVALPFLYVPLFVAGDAHAGILLFLAVSTSSVCSPTICTAAFTLADTPGCLGAKVNRQRFTSTDNHTDNE